MKSSGEMKDLKVRFFGSDTAIATYSGHFSQMGHKNKKIDFEGDFACLDVWYRVNGQWKEIASTTTSTTPMPSEEWEGYREFVANPM